jgi:hypothetical protein
MRTIRIISLLKSLSIASALLIAPLLIISPVQAADVDLGVRGGVYPDEEEPFLGGEVLFGMDQTQHWYGNPNVEYVFLDNGGLTTYSFDFHYDFSKAAAYTLWAGGGPTIIHRDFDVPPGVDNTDPGVNLLFGVGGTEGKVRPYGQFKVIVAEDPAAVAAVGIRF